MAADGFRPVNMPLRLHRASVIDQAAQVLREGVDRGDWQDWLPGERRLSDELQVGRNTVRAALQRLAREGCVRIVPGQGSRVARSTPARGSRVQSVVGLLAPEPLDRLRPRQALWIDALRASLAEAGCLLKLFDGPQYFRANPEAALARLVEQEKCGCWVLVRSNRGCQRWFEQHRVPCVIAGSCHEGLRLPFVDLDHRALCRHAANTLLRLGHRRIAFLTQVPAAAGDMMSESGFLEGAKLFPAPAEAVIVHHGTGKQAIVHGVRRLMQRAHPPTALLVNNSYLYLTVFSILAQSGRRIPQDVSLISRDADTFLSHLDPEPACYVEDPHQFARKLARITTRLLQGVPPQPPQVQLIPRLEVGASLARVD